MSKSKVKLLESDGKTWSYCYSKSNNCRKHNHPASLKIVDLFKNPTLEKIKSKTLITDNDEIITYSNYLVVTEKQSRNEDFDCKDCGINTLYGEEYYMLNDSLWNSFKITKGMLCIGCVEKRLGRELAASDFTDAPINQPFINGKSARLLKRIFNN